ncbi:GGDEF domain-containing protein [Acuticoccus sp. M5D2P5]|uniref:GGDEF domain-containing protein n=1 Tax=Acuticoccus kalidii TaxID=2910977 RepID=UPI001F1A8AAD|nr:GGDEF domain-containing protein [Acuticoccus kalidii]MCF3934749.1 GGDEF domain-containing protein [Acuticoccus kalidii]
MTLYLIILFNFLALSILWGAIAFAYRTLKPARYWLAACVLLTATGGTLMLVGNGESLRLEIFGNVLSIVAIGQFSIGLRIFFGKPARPSITLAVVLGVVLMMVLPEIRDSVAARNLAFSSARIVLLVIVLVILLDETRYAVGRRIGIVGVSITTLGHVGLIAGDYLMLRQITEEDGYYLLTSYALLASIFGAVVWSLGFAVMTIERLHDDVAMIADVDDLTGLPSRRVITRQFRSLAAAPGDVHSLLLFDLDKFKPVNDTFGHAAGDAALRHFATIARQSMRESDVIARLGGDEFCAILPHTRAADAEAIASRVLAALQATPVDWKGDPIHVSSSVGIAEWDTREDAQFAVLISRADAALYTIKSGGGGKIAIYEPVVTEHRLLVASR